MKCKWPKYSSKNNEKNDQFDIKTHQNQNSMLA